MRVDELSSKRASPGDAPPTPGLKCRENEVARLVQEPTRCRTTAAATLLVEEVTDGTQADEPTRDGGTARGGDAGGVRAAGRDRAGVASLGLSAITIPERRHDP